MEGLKEITGTAGGFRYPEHTYILNKQGKLCAYIKEDQSEPTLLTKPMRFEKTRRKFKKIKVNSTPKLEKLYEIR